MMTMKRSLIIAALLLVIVVVVVAASILSNQKRSTKSLHSLASSSGCINQTFSTGSQGECVSDLQTLVDFMETDQLPQCGLPDAPVIINGQYSSETTAQVKAAQQWVNCYARQEGGRATLPVTGIVAPATWQALCTYAYANSAKSGAHTSPYFKQALTAGNQAGCSRA